MAEKNRPTGQPYELFGEVERRGQDTYKEDVPGYDYDNPTEGQEVARQSVPLRRRTDQERREQQQELEENAPTVMEGADLATQQEWPLRQIESQQRYPPDPDLEMSGELLEEVAPDLSEDAFHYIASNAVSKDHAEYLAEQYRQDQSREDGLAQLGWTGTTLRVGAALFSPSAWGLGVGASAMFGPAGLVGTAANRLSRAQKVVRGGTAGATGNLAMELAIRENKPIYDDMNMLYAVGLGFGIGGGLSAISRNPSTRVEADGLRKVSQGLKRTAEKEVREFEEAEDFSRGDAGAARASREVPLMDGDGSIDDFESALKADPSVAPKAAFADVRFSSMALGLSSKNPAVRAIFKPMAEEGVGYTDRNIPVVISASERQRMREMKVTTEWMRGYDPNFHEWRKAQSKTGRWKPNQSERMAQQFNQEVTDYVEGILDNPNPAVARQGDIMRKIFDDYRVDLNQPMGNRQEFGEGPGVFGTIEENPNYVPHEFNLDAVRQLTREFGSPNMEYMLAQAVKRGTKEAGEEITEETALRAGQAYLKTIRGLDQGMGMDTARVLGSGDADQIKQFLKDNADGDVLPENEIEDIVDALTARTKSLQGGPKHAKSRTPLAMDTELTLKRNPEEFPMQGSRKVSVREIFNRDAHDLMAKYNRRMSGSLAMAQYRIPGLADGIQSNAKWETVKNKARDLGARQGIDPAQTNRELAEADLMYRAIMGVPNQADLTRFGETLKFFRDWSFMRFMGQVGFAQIPEAGVAASGLGLKSLFKGVPVFRGLIRDAQTGKLSHDLVDEIEIATGYGGDWLRSGQLNRFNDMTGTQDTVIGKSNFKDNLEWATRKGKRATFAGSGMATINTVMKRSVANGIVQKFGMAALGSGKLLNKNRLRSIGLSDRQVDNILDNIRNHAEFDEGLTGKKVRKLNLHKWDLASEADFTESMFRYANRLVQENDIGQFRQWMAHPVARMFLQFRSFIIGAHEKQLLHNIHMRDFQSFSTFASTTMLAALGYTAMTYSRSIGKSNQEEYLRHRLSAQAVAKASFERSSWAALLPTAVDTMFPGTFQFSRSSGQQVSAQFGNPTFDTGDSLATALRTIASGGALDSQEDAQNILRLLPFQNMNGVAQMTNVILGESGLPEDAPRD